MKPHRTISRNLFPTNLILLIICIATLLLFTPVTQGSLAAPDAAPDKLVQQAWNRASDLGAYQFDTTIEQTTYPAPAIANVGRSSQMQIYYLQGAVDRTAEALSMMLWQNGGNLATGQDGFEMHIQDGKAYGRTIGGTWQEIDDFSGLFAPGSDPLAYLAGAKNFQLLHLTDLPTDVRAFSFEIDGPTFASYLRIQLEDQLRRTGELPYGLSLDTPRAYREMSGIGQIWLDEDGLPLRLSMDLEFPDTQTGERVIAAIQTDFSDFERQPAQVIAFWDHPLNWAVATLNLPDSPDGWQTLLPQIGFWLLIGGLLILFIICRYSKRVYAAFAGAVIISMVFTPLLQSQQVSAYYDRQKNTAAEATAQAQIRESTQQAQEELLTSNWDPHQEPLSINSEKSPMISNSSSISNLQSLASSNAEDDTDTDLDGLTDDLESALGTDPADVDSDGDRLDDGVEYLRLGTDPLVADSDGDGIKDNVEVAGFQYNAQDWYLDPNAADSNGDGRIDMIECPDLVGRDRVNGRTCLDQDTDGIPDAFDRDDDGDGLADRIDLYPDGLVDRNGSKSNGLNLDYFNGNQPFKFKVASLQPDLPVFVDFQIVPENNDHLTYALNVLDWPATDTDGQVQHVKNTTFASSMTDAQQQANPSAAYGDMRLIPMLEIVMTGSQVPLPLTNPFIEIRLDEGILGSLHLEQNASDTNSTDFNFSFEDQSADYTVAIYEGSCPISGTPLITFSNVGDGDTFVYADHIVDLADGEHAVTISDGSEGDCASLGNIVNGPYRNKMIDPELIQPYGISVREINKNGKLAAYAPVNMVPGETGSGRVAFQARMAYQLGTSSNWQKEQEVRLIWMVQMLTDDCDTSDFISIAVEDETAANERLQTWCAIPDNRTPDGIQIVQTYDDSWVLTGMSVREDHGLDTAIIYEDPANGDVTNSENLWQAARSLSAVFLAGRNEDGDNYRDVSIYINDQDGDRVGNSNIYNRLDADGNIPDGDERRWGIEQGTLQVERERYPHQDYLAYQAMTGTPDILDNFAHDDIPTLLFAREEHSRGADLHTISLSNGVFSFDMSTTSQPKGTFAGLRWMPYRYNTGTDPDGQVIGWEPYPAAEYWDQLEIKYQDIFAQIDPDLDAETHLGQAVVARAYYISLMQGLVQQVGLGSWTPDPRGDSDAALIAGLTGGFGKKIGSIVYDISADFVKEYGSWGEFIEVGIDRYNNVHTAIYEEIHGFWYSIGKSIKANTIGPWGKLFSGGFKSKMSAGIALAGGIAVIGLTLFAVSQESSGFAAAEIVLAGLTVVMAIQGVVSATARVIEAVNKYGSFTAAMRGDAASVSANARSSISKAAVIGLIIGVVITWGTVIAMIGLQAGLGGGISGTAIANSIAGAIASTVVAIIMFAIAAIPLVGWIIAAVVGIIDTLVNMLCTIFVPDDAEDHPAVSWFCGGLTGIVTKALTALIYSGNQMVNMYPEDYNRLEFGNFEADDLVHPDWGLRQGNSIRYGVSLTNTIDVAPLPDNLGAGYRYQFSDNTLRTSTFDYQLTYTNTTEIHENLDRKTMSGDWVYQDGDGPVWGDFGHTWHAPEPVYIEKSVQSTGIELSQAGINMPTSLYLTEGYALPSQNCILGICTIWTERGSEHYDLGSAILLDVFPATLTDFYQLAAKNEGYALAWAQEGNNTFPRLQDADGDGIPYYVDQHDNTWDNDGDMLSDKDEVRLGTDPDDGDSDNDGLRDDLELLASTNPLRPDSDGDGLLDSEEVFHQDIFDQDGDGNSSEWLGGWYFVYDLAADGTPLETWVIPSPMSGDSDGDTLTDYQEKTYGMNPLQISNPSVLTFESSLLEDEGGSYVTSDGFVQPGDTLYYEGALKNELYNRWAHGLLGTDFPTEFSNTNIYPENFLLYPQEQQNLAGEVPVSGNAAPGVYNLTQTAGALISDWRDISQDASLWFPFDDASDAITYTDRSGNIPAHDGTCSNPAPGVGCLPVKDDGVFGGSLQFDGSVYVTADYDPSDTDYAVSFWFKTDQANGALFAIDGWLDDLDRQIYLRNGQVKAQLKRFPNTQTLSSAETYNDGHWHHLVHTFGTAINGQRLYLDGILVDSGNLQSVIPHINGIYVGRTNASTDHFNGRLDELRIYDKTLSHAEIEVLFNTPVLDLRFNSDSGWKDSSPFKNNASCGSDGCPTRGNGIDGQAADFNGLTYLSVGADDSLDLSEGTFTMGAWIYPDNTPRYCSEREWNDPDCATEEPQPQGILGFGTGGSNAYPSLQRVGQQLRFTFGDNEYFTTGDVLRPYRWNHVAVAFDGAAVKIFVDGELVAQDATTFNGQVPPENSTLTVGRSGNRAVLKAKKIRVANVGEGENTGEICLAFKAAASSSWYSLLDQDIQEGLVDGGYLPILIDINTQRSFNNGGTLLLWENDSNPRCVTDDNKYDDSPINGNDDFLYIDTFTTYEVSEGYDGNTNENFAVFEYDGAARGFVYYVYENDSIPFHGRIDEVQIYNRPLDESGIADMYQAHRKALHLQLDDAPGTTSFVDASFDPQQATCSGENCPIAGVPGRVNQAVLFDGNDSLSLGKSEINRLTDELTLAAWVRPESLSGLQWIAASARVNSANGYGLALDGSGLRFQAFGVHTYDFPTAGLQAGEWTHIAAVLDTDNNVTVYLNGVLSYFASGDSSMVPDTDDLFLIGAGTLAGNSTRQDFFHGKLDDLYIFSNALGETSIQKLYGRAPFVQLHLDEGILFTSNFYDFPDAANSSYSAHCQGSPCPEFGFAIDGQLGTAVEFNGFDDALTYPYRSGLDQSQYSLSAWVLPTEVKDGWQTLVSRGYPDIAYGLFIQPDSMTLAFITGDGSCNQQILLAENPLVQNVWNHITAVKENGEMKIYLNGQIQGELSANTGYCNQGATMVIGGGFSHPDSRAFSGRIDEVAFYTHALTWDEIAETYSYQAKWVEEHQNHTVTVDDDLPAVELTTTGDYLPLTDIQMLITASDPTSGVDTVELGIRQPGVTVYRWQVAPPCQDSLGATTWCPTFDPTIIGEYSLSARVTDNVGHVSRATGAVTVENAPPAANFNFAANALLTPVQNAYQTNTWLLALSGTVSDPSGVDADTLTITLLNQDGLMVSPGAQRATLFGDHWTLAYQINTPDPSGIYTVRLTALDVIAVRSGLDDSQKDTHTRVLEQSIQIDATPPSAFLDLSGIPSMLAESQTITGSVTENPVPLELAFSTDVAGDELDLTLTCAGELRYEIESGQLPARTDDFTWSGKAHRGAACTLALTDSGGNGGTSGTITVCGAEIATWDGTFTTDHTINFNAEAAACGPALDVNGNTLVETALISQLPGSSEHNSEPLPGKLLNLPLDESPSATESLYFGDLSGLGLFGVCGGACPAAAQAGHNGNAVFFDGLDDEIIVIQDQDLGGRDQLSISVWLQPKGYSSGIFLHKDNECALLRHPVDREIYYQLGNTAPGWGNWVATGYTAPEGQWTNFVLTYDGSQIQTYINGQPFHASAGNGVILNQSDLILGSNSDGNHFRGLLDEVQVYERALSSSEIRTLYLGATPVLHLPLEDSWASDSMTLLDASSWDNHARLQTGSQSNNLVTGQVGAYALNFDGLDDTALVADNPALDLDQFSLSLWINTDFSAANDNFHPVLVKGTADNEQVNYGLYLDQQNGNLNLRIDNAACTNTTYFPFIQHLLPGNWHHIAATYDGNEVVLHLNGQETWRTAYTGGTCQNDEPVRLGQDLSSSFSLPFYSGMLDDIFIYPRAISDGEVTSIYARGWQMANTTPIGSGVALANWNAQTPSGLEGVYQIDLRAWDMGGNVSAPQSAIWQGEVDNRAPRLTLESELLGDNVRYTATAEDFNLAADGLVTPCGAAFNAQSRYFEADWYQALFPNLQRLDGLTAVCERPSSELPGEVGATDTPGLARSVVVSGTLAYLADSGGGLQIIDFSNPAWPQQTAALSVGYANDLVVSPGGLVLRPDLTVTSLEVSPAAPELEASFTISVTVQNQGLGRVYGFDLSLYQDAQPAPCEGSIPLWTAAIPVLDAGQSAVVVFSHPGLGDLTQHNFYAQADSGCAITEVDEVNNIFGPEPITAVQADLIVESMTLAPASIHENQPITVTVTIRNQGTGTARNLRTSIYLDTVSVNCGDSGWDFDDTEELVAGETVSYTYAHSGFPQGAYSFLAAVDSECSLTESNESNNTQWKNFTVLPPAQPDLIVTNIQASDTTPFIGESFVVTITVHNQGDGVATSFENAVFEDYEPLVCGDPNWWDFSRLNGGLAAGDSALLTFTHSGFSTLGEHTIVAQADSSCEIAELYESNNNSFSLSVNVTDPNPPDLVIDSFEVPTSVMVGETYIVTATVTNQGLGTAVAPYNMISLATFVNRAPYGCDEVADGGYDFVGMIAPSETVIITTTMLGPNFAGTHNLYAFIDSGCAISETSENNNVSGPSTMNVTGGTPIADLVVRNAAMSPYPVSSGQPFSITVSVDNIGTLGTGSFEIGIFTDTVPSNTCLDTPWATQTFSSLAAGARASVTFSYPGIDTPGTDTFYAMADAGCAQTEYNEGNNTDSILISVQSTVMAKPAPVADPVTELVAIQVSTPSISVPLASPEVTILPTLSLAPAQTNAAPSYVYLAEANGLRIFNVDDPARPLEVGALGLSGIPRGIALSDEIAYLATQSEGLHAVDISNPGYPGLLDTLMLPGFGQGVAVSGNYAFIVAGIEGLQVVDISNPADLQIVGSYNTPGYAYAIVVVGNYAYIADGSEGLQVIDISNPANPQPSGELDTTYQAKGIALVGAQAYLADGAGGLRVIDVSNPTTPILLRSFDTPGNAEGVALSTSFVLVADYDSGLRIINASGILPQATACDLAGNCATATMTQSFANLAQIALMAEPQVEINYALAEGPLMVTISNLPPVLDSNQTITVTGYASTTLTTLDAITVTTDGAPLVVQGWSSGATESDWSAAWTPSADGPYQIQAEVSDADSITSNTMLTVTIDTFAPNVIVSPTLYIGRDYYEPRTIELSGDASDAGGVTKVEILGLDGIWRKASLRGGNWRGSWQLGDETLPDSQNYTVQVRATDIAGHTTTISEIITVDVLPPTPVELTLLQSGTPLQPGDLLSLATANLTLEWTASSDGGGLAGNYQVAWTTQVTSTASQSWQSIPSGNLLTTDFIAYDGQKISALWGVEDTLGNQRWQEFGSVVVDSPLTPDYVALTPNPSPTGRGELYRGWMGSGCTDLGIERRAEAGSYSQAQEFYGTWDTQALRLAWLGADWDADGDLFIYLDTTAGGSDAVLDPYGGGANISLPTGMLADAIIWVQDRRQATLLRWTGSNWSSEPFLDNSYQWSAVSGRWSDISDLYLHFEQIGLTAGDSLEMIAFATEEGALDLWAARPQGNLLNSPRITDYRSAGGQNRNFDLTQLYHWDAVTAGVCPNGNDQPGASTAFPDADLQVRWEANPAGVGYSLIGDGLYWLQDELFNSPPADFSTQMDFLIIDQPPLPNTALITYTLEIHNRGWDTAKDVQAVVNAEFALSLLDGDPVQQTIAIGDIPAGESKILILCGQIDTSRSPLSWARAGVEIYDAAHPNSGVALEYLWLDQQVDREGPIFVGLQQPSYLLGSDGNWLSGYAYDEAGVTSVEIQAQGPQGVETLTCPLESPHSGTWDCLWDMSGQNGDLFNLRLQATDDYGQPGDWNTPQTYMLDTQAPTITLDLSITQVISGSLVKGLNFSLAGKIADNGGVGQVDVCLDSDCQPAALKIETGHQTVVIEDAPGAAIPINSSTTCNGGEIIRTFEITESLKVGEVQLGFSALHDQSDDLKVVLISPSGVTATLLTDDGLSGTNFQNVDVWLHDAASKSIANRAGNQAPGAPFYAFESRPAQPLQTMIGTSAQGTWTLEICDANPNSAGGTYLRSLLVVRPQDPYAKQGYWSAQVENEAVLDYVPQKLEIYGQDVVGNRMATPLNFDVIVDNVAPVITVTERLSEGYIGKSGIVLAGTLTEGGPRVSLWVHVLQPNGELQRFMAAQQGGDWYFEMDYESLGEYQLWLTTADLAGNISVAGAYAFSVLEEPTIYLPLILNRYDGRTVYELGDSPGEEWSSQEVETAPSGEVFLGPFNNDDLSLDLEDLPPHSQITISFDLYIIRSWDGNQVAWLAAANQVYPMFLNEIVGPDIWSFQAGGQTLLTTTFSNWPSLGFDQAFPDGYPEGNYPAQTGAIAVNTLGYTFGESVMDTTYHLEFSFDHSDSTLQSGFSATSLQIGEDESWGIDNVVVMIVP